MNNPEKIKEMAQAKVLSEGRAAFLLNFPWDMDIIYHEAGVPPLHTSVNYLNSLPEEIQKKVTGYHIAEKDSRRRRNSGSLNSVSAKRSIPTSEKHIYEEAYQILRRLFSRIDIFKSLPTRAHQRPPARRRNRAFEKARRSSRKGPRATSSTSSSSGSVSIAASRT
jgi:hypothetical protein